MILTLHIHVLDLLTPVFVEICSWHAHGYQFISILWPVRFNECDVNKDSENSSDMRANNRNPEPVVVVPAEYLKTIVKSRLQTMKKIHDFFYLKDCSHPAMRLMSRGERSLAGLSA